MERPSDFRIQPVTEPDEELQELLAATLIRDGKPLNIFGVLSHHPDLMKRFNRFAGWLLNRGVVAPRDKEIVILRVGSNARCEYEFGQHTMIGKDRGLTDAEIYGLTRPTSEHGWNDADADLIALADEICADDCVSDETWTRLERRWGSDALIELVMIAGMYRLVSGFLNSTGVQLDDGVPGWPHAPAGI